ncbi:hypothetical protein AT6N2_C1947 [Agrobacterium tumefaciens]|nr:hypothetical protein AT6N2_C1947 [Agrobacterium tumefaciens]
MVQNFCAKIFENAKKRLIRLFSGSLSPHFRLRVFDFKEAISGCYPSQKFFAFGVHFP